MSLDQSRLENVHPSGGKVLSRCPACAEQGGDKTGDHLFQAADGKWGCIQFPGDAGKDHRKRIFEMVGVQDLAPATPNAAPFKSCVPPTKSTKNDSVWGPWKYVETYDYVNAKGALLFHVDRSERFDQYGNKKKKFPCRRPGQSINAKDANIDGVERVLYKLPRVLAQVAQGGDVFVVEGEKDVAAMESLGLCATCNPGGAGNWKPAFSETLRGAGVTIIGDKDERGREHVAKVQAALQGIADTVRVMELPDRPGHKVKDAADWVAAGGTADELAELMRAADESTTAPDEFPALTLADLQDYQPNPERDHIAGNGWLRRGAMTLFIGATGIGKSVAIEQACISVAAGLPIFGCIAVDRPRKVVLLQAENDEETMKRDALAIVAGIQADANTVTRNLTTRWAYALTGDRFIAYVAALLERERPDLLALDNYQAFSGDDINSTEAWQAWYRPIIKACVEYHAALLLVDHTTKPKTETKGAPSPRQAAYDAAGTSGKANGARCSCVLSEVADDPRRFRLRFGKNAERTGLLDANGYVVRDLFLEHSDNPRAPYWRLSGDQFASSGQYDMAIRKAIADDPRQSATKIGKGLGCSTATITRAMKRMGL